jgi:hypothetical protein
VTDDTLGVMNRWVVLLAVLGACVIDPLSMLHEGGLDQR